MVTCFHVIVPKEMKEGHLVAATESGTMMPVVEVLAGSRANDVAIVRVQSDKPLETLSLNTGVRPGDEAWCYSDPFGRSGYFSKGIVNRFFQRTMTNVASTVSVRMNVSTDWAPGSSGSAVLVWQRHRARVRDFRSRQPADGEFLRVRRVQDRPDLHHFPRCRARRGRARADQIEKIG